MEVWAITRAKVTVAVDRNGNDWVAVDNQMVGGEARERSGAFGRPGAEGEVAGSRSGRFEANLWFCRGVIVSYEVVRFEIFQSVQFQQNQVGGVLEAALNRELLLLLGQSQVTLINDKAV